MKYVKLRVSGPERGLLYEADLSVPRAFGGFVVLAVSDLIEEGVLREGDHYSAVIVPRYAGHQRQALVVDHDPERARQPQDDWVEMCLDGAADPARPVRYVTLELRLREPGLVYSLDFPGDEVAETFVIAELESALRGRGVIQPEETYRADFVVHEDDRAQLHREHIPQLERQAAALVELLPEAALGPSFERRAPETFAGAAAVGCGESDDIRIYVNHSVMERLREEGRRSLTAERGGVLVGQVYDAADGGRRLVEISDFIISEHARSTVVEFRYTFESWRSHTTLLRQNFPDKRIVGWYHTHLMGIPVLTDDDRLEVNKLFFSTDDVFLHRHFFPDEWYVALVLDTEGKGLFFQWKGQEVTVCPSYHVFDALTGGR